MTHENNHRFADLDYDYYDFGCSSGLNIVFNNSIFPGYRGLGIDIDEKKIDLARQSGHHALRYNILDIPDTKQVKFVTMSHFLEHLGGVEAARKMIVKAVSVSQNFVFIRQPWFDSDGLLFLLGYKFYWSHWRGHRNKMTALDFHSILTPEIEYGRISRFEIFGRSEVMKTEDPCLLPLDAPVNQHRYQIELHGRKGASQSLPRMVFKEILVAVCISDAGISGIEAIIDALGGSQLLYSSGEESR